MIPWQASKDPEQKVEVMKMTSSRSVISSAHPRASPNLQHPVPWWWSDWNWSPRDQLFLRCPRQLEAVQTSSYLHLQPVFILIWCLHRHFYLLILIQLLHYLIIIIQEPCLVNKLWVITIKCWLPDITLYSNIINLCTHLHRCHMDWHLYQYLHPHHWPCQYLIACHCHKPLCLQ